MGKVAVEHIFNGPTTGVTTYDPNYTMLGDFFVQYTGATSADEYVSAKTSPMINQVEIAGGSFFMPFVYQWSSNIYWIFMGSNATAAVTRNFAFYEYNSDTGTLTYKGFITLSGTTFAGVKTIRALRAFITKHTTGTVSTSGLSATINGSSTLFTSDRIAVGARIGFGSTDPTEITTWYEISGITNDTTLAISGSINLTGATSYVIEEIRILTAITNATLANGGLFLIKGLNYSTFSMGGTVIVEASATDNLRASYFIRDAATSTLQIAMGVASDDAISATEHYVYGLNLDTATTVRIFKFNIREALTVSGGASISAFVFKTNTSTTTGTISQINNGRIFTLQHGSASGLKSIWFVSTTRIYRVLLADVVDSASNIIADFMIEIPPGSSTTYSLTNSMNQVDYSSYIDRILIPTGVGRFGTYLGQYDPSGSSQFDKIIGGNITRLKLTTTDSGAINGLYPTAAGTVWTEGGYLFVAPNITTTGLNWLMVIPLGGDGTYASYTNAEIITPKLSTINATKFYRVYVNNSSFRDDPALGGQLEAFKTYFRTSGIDDNSGSWTEVPIGGDMSSFTPGDYIQFKFEIDTVGNSCVATKIYSVTCLYDDFTTDIHYQPSVKYSNYINKQFAWWFSSAWGTTVPTLRVRLYDAETNNILLDDNTASPTGTWEKSTDGGSNWSAYDTTDRANSTTYIRYTPASMADNIKVKFLLTEL